jgi:hypothetical protein
VNEQTEQNPAVYRIERTLEIKEHCDRWLSVAVPLF